MKKLITVIILMSISLISFTQTLPNNDFQIWNDNGAYESPNHWSTPDTITSALGIITVSKSTDAYIGDYSAKLETRIVPLIELHIPGMITLAEIGIVISPPSYTINGGFALNKNVSKLTGMYRYDGVEGDSATVLIYNFKHDEGSEFDTIGYGVTYLHDATDWTLFTVEMQNLNYHVPDTFNVIIMSSSSPDFSYGEGSVLLVDDLTIETNTGIINLNTNKTIVNIYPNPTSDYIQFETIKSEKGRKVSIYNVVGKLIYTTDFNNPKIKIHTNTFPSGIYTYQVTRYNSIINTGSFISK